MSTTFVDGLDSASGESESDSFFKFWDINALFLEIGVLPNHPCRVELGGTGPVGVSASNFRTLH